MPCPGISRIRGGRFNVEKAVAEEAQVAQPIVTPAQVNLWVHDLVAASGTAWSDIDRKELVAYTWSRLILQLEEHRRKKYISFDGFSRRLVELHEFEDIFWEFDNLRKNAGKPYTVDELVAWIEKQLNALLIRRGVKSTYESQRGST